MGVRTWRWLLIGVLACGPLSPPVASAQGRARSAAESGAQTGRDRELRDGRDARANRTFVLRSSRAAIDPYATGYERGHEKGVEDGRDGNRYDPVRHRNYRDGDEGYSADYGSRDAYRNNYRAGFRQGYEEGYRHGSRNRR